MIFASMPLISTAEVEIKHFHEYRGSRVRKSRPIPWRDVDNSLFIAVNHRRGDDVGQAIDFRSSRKDPRVIGSECTRDNKCLWREVAPTFTSFFRAIGLIPEESEDVAESRGASFFYPSPFAKSAIQPTQQ
jgi:hypothetical protein